MVIKIFSTNKSSRKNTKQIKNSFKENICVQIIKLCDLLGIGSEVLTNGAISLLIKLCYEYTKAILNKWIFHGTKVE